MKKWRDELTEMMISSGCVRMPAIRRSNRDHYLFATDYPSKADQKAMYVFIDRAVDAGWHIETVRGWIHLDRKAVFEAAETVPEPGPEAFCCLSLLERHPDNRKQSDGSAERLLLKAMEEGRETYERTCEILHAEWAVLLRKMNGLPDIDHRFFGGEKNK